MRRFKAELQAILSTPDPPDPDTPVNELGLDSLMAVEFSTRLQQQMGADFAIAPTLLFDYPTVNALTDYLLGFDFRAARFGDRIESAGAYIQSAERTSSRMPSRSSGMSCRFPGADDRRGVLGQSAARRRCRARDPRRSMECR